VDTNDKIERSLGIQILLSSILLSGGAIIAGYISLPDTYNIGQHFDQRLGRKPWHAFVSTIVGLWSGCFIGWITEYMTSHSNAPVRELAGSCKTGAATNIIYGLALGYNSTIVPAFLIALNAFLSHKLLGFYGVSLAALGMLGSLPIGLAIDGYGPISDNAGGIAEMADLGEIVRERTDALDAAGNTTAAIGKGFAIGSAALVSLALFGGFITRSYTWTLDKSTDKMRHGLTNV
jgi:Na+/H+-translocating membrane pyrophosphatase